ncbi:arsenic ABC transporter ATPase [Niallia circulans]|uniref:Arsenic ABC transporter ATPase n=1 Tax=Niallia circulans TaxID=1397 RepID=A0A0J1IHZ6_NIACI|nr:arsenical pump-driving ATPase [Niallia circulans]KLV25526.1 arsenic ABC transporter ATPase [Niallia circulans]HEO8420416.1 arsenical pump-driving ATPase [Yersinia enterocolitica]
MEKFNPLTLEGTPFLFFTGKGGVGKTSTASATAIALADGNKKVLLVSTDPASNLQDVFEMELSNEPTEVKGVKGLSICNIDPEQAAVSYKNNVIGPYRDKLPEIVIAQMEEQLSGACTVEIAAFDEFTNLLSNPQIVSNFDHIIFDTAPTGHTLRLLQLPTAWTGYLNESTHGASCLGPLSGLDRKKEVYEATVQVLSDPDQTKLILVSRPERFSLNEAERASKELKVIGIRNQVIIINGLLESFTKGDRISEVFHQRQSQSLKNMPTGLKGLSQYFLPFVPYSLTGISSFRSLFSETEDINKNESTSIKGLNYSPIEEMVRDLYENNSRVIFTMGKGGVGKTTLASIISVGLAHKGKKVHLTTTDPAAHIGNMFDGNLHDNLTISRIDPEVEVDKYRKEVLERAKTDMDQDSLSYLEEDLNSPCTEEIAVFRAFAEVVSRSNEEVVIIDTAPTGHTLLLLDAAESYHKEIKKANGDVPLSVQQLLPRLRNSNETSVIITTLAEATPVIEAQRLQEDLLRADIRTSWWVINQSIYATETTDPILEQKAQAEKIWMKKIKEELHDKVAIIPWEPEEIIGYKQIQKHYFSEDRGR